MIEILRDHSENAIKLAFEANLHEYIKTTVIPGEEVLDSDEVFRWYSGRNLLLRNWVLNPKFTPENARLKVEEQINFFKRRKTIFLWWNGPSAQPSNISKIMQEAGMIKFILPTKSGDMVKDIRNLEKLERIYKEIIEKTGIEIRVVHSKEEIHLAAKVVVKTMGLSENFRERGEKSCELMLREDPSVNKLVGYYACVNNVPVSVSTVFYGSGVAGIYSVGTLPKYQHRGIGTAITLAPLIDAHKRGYEIAVLTATAQGFPVYDRIGFRKLEVMEQYYWIPQTFKRFLYKMYLYFQRIKYERN